MASEMTEMGESLEHVDSLIEELNKFHLLCQVTNFYLMNTFFRETLFNSLLFL